MIRDTIPRELVVSCPPLRWLWAILIPIAALAGQPLKTQRVALLGAQDIGGDPKRATRLNQAVETALQLRTDVTLQHALTDCTGDDACISRVAQETQANVVLSVGVASLGNTHALRVRVYHGKSGALMQALTESVTGDDSAVVARLEAMVRQVFPVPPPKATAPHLPRWVTVTAAVVLAGAATILPFALSSDSSGLRLP